MFELNYEILLKMNFILLFISNEFNLLFLTFMFVILNTLQNQLTQLQKNIIFPTFVFNFG